LPIPLNTTIARNPLEGILRPLIFAEETLEHNRLSGGIRGGFSLQNPHLKRWY